MTSSLRARIVAIVSSEEQATDDRSSLSLQVERAREVIQRRGWVEVAPPIQISQSRDFYSLAALRTASPDYDELCRQAESGIIDVIVARDHSRALGRTEALQTACRTHFQLCRVQLYFYTSPVEPVPPEQLGRRGRGQIGARYLDAIAGVRDEEEVARLAQRHEDGMNAHARAGRWKLAWWPTGYVRPVIATVNGRRIRGDLEIVPDEAELIRTIFRHFQEGHSSRECYLRYCALRGREPGHSRGDTSKIVRLLSNPAYVGVMVYGIWRSDVKSEDGVIQKVRQTQVTYSRRAALALDWLNGQDGRTEEEIAGGVIVAWGEWEPIIERDTWIAVQHELRRRAGRGSYMGNEGGIFPLSGLLYCGRCGTKWNVSAYSYTYRNDRDRKASEVVSRRPIYACGQRNYDGRSCPEKGRVEGVILSDLFALLREYMSDEGLLNAVLQQPPADDHEAREQEVALLEKQIQTADLAIQRWDRAFETADITSEEWKAKVGPHREKKAEATIAIKRLQAQQQQQEDPARRATRVRSLLSQLQGLDPAQSDRYALKLFLRQLLSKVILQDKRIVHIVFN